MGILEEGPKAGTGGWGSLKVEEPSRGEGAPLLQKKERGWGGAFFLPGQKDLF